MNLCRFWLCLSIAAAAAAPAAGAAGDDDAGMLLAGNDRVLWLVRPLPDGQTYDVVAKPADGRWTWITQQVRGRPGSMTVTNGQLHLLLAGPLAYLVYNVDGRTLTGRNPSDDRWPSGAGQIALCQAPGVAKGNASAIVAVVPRSASATSAAKTPAASPPRETNARATAISRLIQLGVFQKSGSDWQHLTDYPTALKLTPKCRVLATAIGEALYVMVSDPQGLASHLGVFEGGQWRQIPITGWPADAHAIALLSAYQQPMFVLAAPVPPAMAEDETRATPQIAIHLATYDAGKGAFSHQPVARDGKTVHWDKARPPLVARLADRLAFVRQEGERLTLARCEFSGQLQNISDIDIFEREMLDDRGQRIRQVFMWALLFAVLVPMFFLRSRLPPRPFALPPEMRPARPVKRLVAGLVDCLPWFVISGMIFPLDAASIEDLRRQWTEIVSQNRLPANLAYSLVAAQILYTSYGVFMEHRFGATVGKMIFKMRVVGDGGTRPEMRGILLRNLVRIIELQIPLVVIPIILMIFTRNRQRLGDMMGRTTVIDTTFKPPAGQPSEHHDEPATDSKGQDND